MTTIAFPEEAATCHSAACAAEADAYLAGIRPEVLAVLPAAIERRLHAPEPEPRDWQGHTPLPSFLYGKWDLVTPADLAPSGHFGPDSPVYNTCYPDCPRCTEMAAKQRDGRTK
jgi:hypothetical protein